MNIEQILPCTTEFEKPYNEFIHTGIKFLSSKKIIILGLVRNIENILETNIKKIIATIEPIAADYKIIIFENDSTDNTKNILKHIKNINNNFIYYTENLNRKHYGATKEIERTTALAEYRNGLLHKVKNDFSDYDYVIVSDMDFVDFSSNGCYNSFGWLGQYQEIDGIAGNSFELRKMFPGSESRSLWNYDSWAFRPTWWNYINHETKYVSYDPMLWFGFYIPPVGSSVFRVNSAFGGMTIYKMSKYINGVYDGRDCEHVTFHSSLTTNNQSFSLYLNPSQIMLV